MTKQKWFPWRFGQLLLLLSVLSFLPSCSSFNPLDLVGNGGVNTAANVQAGALNSQTLGSTQITDQTIRRADNSDVRQSSDETKVKSESIKQVTVNELDPLVFGALLLLFIFWSYFLYKLPSPEQIWKKT